MNRSELRALRLAIIDGHVLTEEEALAVVSALETLAEVYDASLERADECAGDCPNESAAEALHQAFREPVRSRWA